jgi:hypothetical protein
MPYGLQISNNSGNVILDSNLKQIPLVASGTGASGTSVTVSFPATSFPFIYARPTSLNAYFYLLTFTTTSFTYFSNSTLDYRIYDGAGNFPTATSGNYGIQVWDSSSNVVYNTSKNPPFIKQITEILSSSTVPPDSVPAPLLLTNVSTSVTSYDGGIPFVSLMSLSLADVIAGGSFRAYVTLSGYWTSATNLSIYWRVISAGGVPVLPLGNRVGQYPRNIFLIR